MGREEEEREEGRKEKEQVSIFCDRERARIFEFENPEFKF